MSKKVFIVALVALAALLALAVGNRDNTRKPARERAATPKDLTSGPLSKPSGRAVDVGGQTGRLKVRRGPLDTRRPRDPFPPSAFKGKSRDQLALDNRARAGTPAMREAATRLADAYGSDYGRTVPSAAQLREKAAASDGVRVLRLTSRAWAVCAPTSGAWVCYLRSPDAANAKLNRFQNKQNQPGGLNRKIDRNLADPPNVRRIQAPNYATVVAVARRFAEQFAKQPDADLNGQDRTPSPGGGETMPGAGSQ